MVGLRAHGRLALALLLASGCSGDSSESAGGGLESASDTGLGTSTSGSTGPSVSVTSDANTSDGTSDGTSTSTTGTGTGAESTGEETTASGDACMVPESNDKLCCVSIELWDPTVKAPVSVTLALTVNGQPLDQGDSDDGDLFLVSATGDRIHVGRSTFGELEAAVFPGVYDLVYESDSRGTLLPWNSRVTLRSAIIVKDDLEIEHDIAVVKATGVISINGQPPPSSLLDDGDIFLVEPASGSRTLIARTSGLSEGGGFAVNAVPGTYDLRYVSHIRKDVMPFNADSALPSLTIEDVADKGDTPPTSTLAPIALVSAPLNGDIQFDGGTPPPSPYDHGRLYLRDRESDAVTLIADTAQGAIVKVPVLAAPGLRYDVIYALVAHKSLAPVNEWATVLEDLDAAGLQAEVATLDLTTVAVSGTLKIDDLPPANDQNNSGEVVLGVADDRALVGGGAGELAGVILAGSYDVFFRHTLSDGGLPVNTRGRVQEGAVDLSESAALDLAVATSTITGTFTLGGAVPPTSVYDTGRVFLRNADGDVVHLGFTSDHTFSRRVINGTYGVYYAVQASKALAPANHEAQIGEITIDGDAAPIIDVQRADLSIPNPFKSDAAGSGRVYLRDVLTDDEIFVGTTKLPQIEATVVPGDYLLVYRVDVLGDVARNDGAVFECLHIEAN